MSLGGTGLSKKEASSFPLWECYQNLDLGQDVLRYQVRSCLASNHVSAVDRFIRTEEDKPTIGIILCRSKRKTTVEFALQDVQKTIGVATYRLKHDLPEALKGSLPTAEQLEMEVNAALSGIEGQEGAERPIF